MKQLSSIQPFARLGGVALALALGLGGLLPLEAAEAPPHRITAANLKVVQNDPGNTVNSVTVTATLSINDLRVRPGSNRGDFNLQEGDTEADDLAAGMVLVAVSENGRDNGELPDEQKNYGAPAFDGRANGYWAVLQDLTSGRAEVNLNCAAAFFRYTNWFCGWARNATAANGGTNNFFTGSPGLLLGTHFRGISNGRSRVDLRQFGLYSTNSSPTNTGVLLVNHAKNEGNYASAVVNSDGTWELYVKDNFANANSLEHDPVAFAFIPKTNTTVVSGRFGLDATGTNAAVLLFSGTTPQFSVTNFALGRYRLAIPGASPDAGVLILSSENAGTGTSGFDNTVSFEPDGNTWIIEHRDVNPFPPELEATTNQPVASFIYIPAASAGFSVTPKHTLLTTEFGLAATATVQLDLAPTSDVVLQVTSSNPAEGLVSPDSLTFTPNNWNLPQTITVTGQNDAVADGDVAYQIQFAAAVSEDEKYSGLKPANLQVNNADDEQAGISVSPADNLVTTEAGGTATFVVVLNRAPTAEVTMALNSENTAEVTVAPPSLTFTPADWNVPQPVTATGVPDFRKDGNQTVRITTAPAVSADPAYHGREPADAYVTNQDVDNPTVLWNVGLPLYVTEGGVTNYSLALATRPDSNVVISVVSGDPSVVTVAPATLTFTAADWNAPQFVTVTGVDNLVTNGSTAFWITNTLSTTDPLYADFAGARPVQGVRLDNESQLILPSGDCIYGLGMPAIVLDGRARLEDADATTYNGGVLALAIKSNGGAADQLSVRNTGTGSGQISVAGAEISYEGAPIGTYTGGLNLTPLVIHLNSNSTLPSVQQLIRSITFVTPATNASLATRSLEFTLDDGLGASAVAGLSVRVGALRQTQYQEGADYGYGDYSGAADLALSQASPYLPWPGGRTPAPQEGLLIDWPDGGTPNESQVLLRFADFVGTNPWQVPSNSVVVSAELLLYINNPGDGGTFHRMLAPWDADNDIWYTLGEGIRPDDVTARARYESQLGVEDGSGSTGTGLISVGATRDVQAWVNGETNFGWVILGWPLRTDGTGFSPSEYVDVDQRPRLRVRWLEPQYQAASFQQGVAGYAGTRDTNLRQASADPPDYLSLGLNTDWNNPGSTNLVQGLLRFDDILGPATNQIPSGSLIHAAVIELSSFGSDAMGDGGTFHAILQPWDDTTATWNSWGEGIQADGIKAAMAPTASLGYPSLDPNVQGTRNTIVVTADLQAWANGARPNYGWAMLPWPNGTDAWISRSSEFNSVVDPLAPEAERPKLRVYFTPGALAIPAVLSSPAVTPAGVQLAFRGTPGFTYTVQRAASVDGAWLPIGPATVGADGTASFTDASPLAGSGFYRIVHP